MPSITVYHGGTEVIEHPLCAYGRPNLDFGKGFYVTDVRRQAVDWARQQGARRVTAPIVCRYQLNRDALLATARCKIFNAYDSEWLEFIVSARLGHPVSYDYVEGGVANDRVIDTVNLYMSGLMDLDTALGRLSQHSPNNQICLLNQELTDIYLTYDGIESIE